MHRKHTRLAAFILMLLLALPSLPARAESWSGYVNVSSMTVYADTALTRSVGKLSYHTIFTVSLSDGRVARIQYKGKTGYCASKDIGRVSDVADSAVVNTACTVYDENYGKGKAHSLKKGSNVYVLTSKNGWSMIEMDGNTGYVKTGYLSIVKQEQAPVISLPTATATQTPAATQKVSYDDTPLGPKAKNVNLGGRVNCTSLTVYKGADTRSTVLGTLKKDVVVTVLAYDTTFAHIEYRGKTGYVKHAYLTKTALPSSSPSPAATPTAAPTPTTAPTQAPVTRLNDDTKAVVACDIMTVYSSVSTDSQKLGTLKKGREVTLVAHDDKWAMIELNGRRGYCRLGDLSVKASLPEATATATAAPTKEAQVTLTYPDDPMAAVMLRDSAVYASASTASSKQGTVKKDQEVTLVAYSEDWALIELNGRRGYCSRRDVEIQRDEPDPPVPSATISSDPLFDATVIEPSARIYATRSTASACVTLSLGNAVSVYGWDSEWAAVKSGTYKGYMKLSSLSRAEYAEIEYGARGDDVLKLQKKLLTLGWFDGIPDGDYGQITYTAVRRFQSSCGMADSGDADIHVLRVLASDNAPVSSVLRASLTRGSTDNDVTRVQTRLYNLGYFANGSSVDGDYGTMTANAVALFQKAAGLTENGNCDKATLSALYSVSAPALPSGTQAADAAASTEQKTVPNSVKLSSSYVTVMPSSLASAQSSKSSGMSNAQKLEYVIWLAQNQLEKPYVYGRQGPDSYDCSGLTSYCFSQVGVSLGRSAYAEGYDGSWPRINSISDLKRGDIVCFNTIADSDLSDHVGIYLGGGCFIHASSGAGKVVVSSLTSSYYNRNFSWGRRILP